MSSIPLTPDSKEFQISSSELYGENKLGLPSDLEIDMGVVRKFHGSLNLFSDSSLSLNFDNDSGKFKFNDGCLSAYQSLIFC